MWRDKPARAKPIVFGTMPKGGKGTQVELGSTLPAVAGWFESSVESRQRSGQASSRKKNSGGGERLRGSSRQEKDLKRQKGGLFDGKKTYKGNHPYGPNDHVVLKKKEWRSTAAGGNNAFLQNGPREKDDQGASACRYP